MTAGRLHLERSLPHPCERVFAAFVDAESLASWWGPNGFTSTCLELDVRVGGRYRLAMQPPEGDRFHLSGEFRVVVPQRRLAFTFAWEEPDPDDRETLVELAFEPAGTESRVVLDQGVFATRARHDLHEAGWTETFDRLEAWLALGPGLDQPPPSSASASASITERRV